MHSSLGKSLCNNSWLVELYSIPKMNKRVKKA